MYTQRLQLDDPNWKKRSYDGAAGSFFFDREPRRTHWLPWTREADADRQQLWKLAEKGGPAERPGRSRPPRAGVSRAG